REWLVQLEEAKKEAKDQKIRELIGRGKNHLAHDRFDEARAQFSEVLKIEPDHEEALLHINLVEKAKVEYENRQLLKRAEQLVEKGIECFEVKDFAKAKSFFHEAVELAPYNNKEEIEKLIKKKIDSALYREKLKYRADVYIAKGLPYLENKQFDEAERLFNKALEIIPEYKRAKEYLVELEKARLKNESDKLLKEISSIIDETAEVLRSE
ncbi:MAG TPA: hypothetical protein EYP78_02170, partial [Candidatus Omnitrophica bacterium]|nr:hypothetical protein [Candidatus Omnitrophota bacterium]